MAAIRQPTKQELISHRDDVARLIRERYDVIKQLEDNRAGYEYAYNKQAGLMTLFSMDEETSGDDALLREQNMKALEAKRYRDQGIAQIDELIKGNREWIARLETDKVQLQDMIDKLIQNGGSKNKKTRKSKKVKRQSVTSKSKRRYSKRRR